MNKGSVLTILIALLVSGGLFAADTKTDAKPEAKPVVATGVVVSFTAADTAKATPAVLVVKVGKKDETFVLDAKSVVKGKDKKDLDPATLKAGEKVTVTYTAAGAVFTIVSLTVL